MSSFDDDDLAEKVWEDSLNTHTIAPNDQQDPAHCETCDRAVHFEPHTGLLAHGFPEEEAEDYL
jgi:hypothetical protein